MSLSHGVYFIRNAKVSLNIELNNGSSNDGTVVSGWEPKPWANASDFNASSQLWLVEPIKDATNTYTLRNIKGGTYFDLSGGTVDNGTKIIGSQGTSGNNQKWVIKKDATGNYRIQNVASQTFVDLYNGGNANGTPIGGWSGQWDSTGSGVFHQQWVFQRMSRSTDEIRNILLRNPNNTQDFHCYNADVEYLILPQGIWKVIWNNSGLSNRKSRGEIFDIDDFALVYKAAVANWGYDNIRADGVAILCGMMYDNSKDRTSSSAYNFTITDDFANALSFAPDKNTFQSNSQSDPFFGLF